VSGIVLVRHAMPNVERGVASRLWTLSEASREDCVLLAHALPQPADAIWSSDEPKARETAEVIGLRLGLPVRIDPAFAEVDRPEIWDREYREVAAAYLRGIVEPGWEAREAVSRRFGDGIARARHDGTGDLVIVNHGLAMSLWLSTQTQLDIEPWWRSLTLPDAWRYETATGTLERVWMGGGAGEG